MELKLDVKTLVIGIALGVVLAATLGADGGSADKADFGIAVPDNGFALVKTGNGTFYAVNVDNADARRIEDKTRGTKRRYLDYDMSSDEKEKKY